MCVSCYRCNPSLLRIIKSLAYICCSGVYVTYSPRKQSSLASSPQAGSTWATTWAQSRTYSNCRTPTTPSISAWLTTTLSPISSPRTIATTATTTTWQQKRWRCSQYYWPVEWILPRLTFLCSLMYLSMLSSAGFWGVLRPTTGLTA